MVGRGGNDGLPAATVAGRTNTRGRWGDWLVTVGKSKHSNYYIKTERNIRWQEEIRKESGKGPEENPGRPTEAGVVLDFKEVCLSCFSLFIVVL